MNFREPPKHGFMGLPREAKPAWIMHGRSTIIPIRLMKLYIIRLMKIYWRMMVST